MNRKEAKALAACALVVLVPVSVGVAAGAVTIKHGEPVTTVLPPCPKIVTVEEGEELTCDLYAPQLNVRWPGADGYDDAYYRQRCEDMGGVFTHVSVEPGVIEVQCDDIDW